MQNKIAVLSIGEYIVAVTNGLVLFARKERALNEDVYGGYYIWSVNTFHAGVFKTHIKTYIKYGIGWAGIVKQLGEKKAKEIVREIAALTWELYE